MLTFGDPEINLNFNHSQVTESLDFIESAATEVVCVVAVLTAEYVSNVLLGDMKWFSFSQQISGFTLAL